MITLPVLVHIARKDVQSRLVTIWLDNGCRKTIWKRNNCELYNHLCNDNTTHVSDDLTTVTL